jgi:glycosyltransferase involved in cell wall biosynthesis
MAEVWLRRNANRGDRVLCFGNLPPLFRLKAFVAVFVQNRYLIDHVGLGGFSIWARCRITFERFWLRHALLNANEFVVQTPTMKILMSAFSRERVPVKVLPFGVVTPEPSVNSQERDARPFSGGFIYVASGEPHKNHRRLIEAWCLLASEKIYPELTLTLDKKKFPKLCNWIDDKKKMHDLHVDNLDIVGFEAITKIYAKAGALIYPSKFESLGLPLIEAQQAGIPVIASELDYVRDVMNPVQTFNPESAISIAKAVKRFIGVSEASLSIGSPASFMHYLLSRPN